MNSGSDWYSQEALLTQAVQQSGWVPPIEPIIPGFSNWQELSRGGQGVVYSATQLSTRRKVAVKILHVAGRLAPRQLGRFEREVDLVAGLQHPHIVRLYDRGLTDLGQPYYVMEYIEGVGLDELITCAGVTASRVATGDAVRLAVRQETRAGRAPLPVRGALELLAQISEAVSYAHQRGVIHRDLKPSNIRIDHKGAPHVLDFGLAKHIATAEPGAAETLSQTGDFLGTLPWASPEQVEGVPEKIDVRTDVYALGVLMYQMLTGRFAYPVVGGLREVITHIKQTAPGRPRLLRPELDADVETIALKCLAKEPDRRYQTAGELARDIRHTLTGEPIQARRESMHYVLRMYLHRHWVPLAAGLTFALLVCAGFSVSTVLWLQATGHRDEARHQAAIATAVNQFLRDILAAPSPYADAPASGRARDTTLVGALTAASAKIGTTFVGQPETEAAARATLGWTYLGLGERDQAEMHLRRALELREQVLGPEHALTLNSRCELGHVFMHQDHFAEAERLFRSALEGQRRVCGPNHLDTLNTVCDLSEVLRRQGHLAEAERLAREAVKALRQVHGEHCADTVMALQDLAAVLIQQGNLAEGETVARQAVDGLRSLFGDNHPRTLVAKHTLARLLQDAGRLPEAEEMYRSALQGFQAALGEEHPTTLVAMTTLASVLSEEGRLTQAERLARASLETHCRTTGGETQAALAAANSLGDILLEQGHALEAQELSEPALASARCTLGDEHPATLGLLSTVAESLAAQGVLNEADDLYCELEELAQRALPEGHWRSAVYRASHARCLVRMGRHAAAEQRLLDAHRNLAASLGENHPHTVAVVRDLIDLFDTSNQPEQSAAWRTRLPGELP